MNKYAEHSKAHFDRDRISFLLKQVKTCAKKRKFMTEDAAWERATEIGLYAYDCNQCDGYHLTKSPRDRCVDRESGKSLIDQLLSTDDFNSIMLRIEDLYCGNYSFTKTTERNILKKLSKNNFTPRQNLKLTPYRKWIENQKNI